MSSKEPRYEITEIKAFPGTESKAITSKQQEGWELVSQQHGRVRTTLSFRRPKPPVPWKMWATVGGVGVILGSIITVGALLEDDAPSAAENTATSSTEQPSLAGLEDDPTSVPDLTVCETGPLTRSCKFGQTAVYSDTVRGGEVKLEITVGEPVEFTPSEAASVALDRPIQPVNVYFPITIRNLSPALPESTLFLTQAPLPWRSGSEAVTRVGIRPPAEVCGEPHQPTGPEAASWPGRHPPGQLCGARGRVHGFAPAHVTDAVVGKVYWTDARNGTVSGFEVLWPAGDGRASRSHSAGCSRFYGPRQEVRPS